MNGDQEDSKNYLSMRLDEKMKVKCKIPALFRYTWPGKDESVVCLEHSVEIRHIAEVIGMPLQMIQIDQRNEIDKNDDIRYCESYVGK